MQVRSRHATGGTHQTDHLSACDGVPNRHECLAEVEIRGYHSSAVIYVDDVTGEKEVVCKRDDASIGCAHRLANGSTEINTEVAARHFSVEYPPRPKFTRDYRCARPEERRRPHQRRIVRALADLSRALVFASNPGCGRGIEWFREAAIH
jgi:hypothetical protein